LSREISVDTYTVCRRLRCLSFASESKTRPSKFGDFIHQSSVRRRQAGYEATKHQCNVKEWIRVDCMREDSCRDGSGRFDCSGEESKELHRLHRYDESGERSQIGDLWSGERENLAVGARCKGPA
jgi:hypothetical protein